MHFLVPAFLADLIFSEGKGALKQIATDKIKKFFEEPDVLKAWNAAGVKIAAEYPILNEYLTKGLGQPANVNEPRKLEDSIQPYFNQATFPNRLEIANFLVEAWKAHKLVLKEDERAEFYQIEQSKAEPILERLATLFFIELAQIQRFFYPAALEILLELKPENKKSDPQITTQARAKALENLRNEFLEAFGRLYSEVEPPPEKRLPITASLVSKGGIRRVEPPELLNEVISARRVLLVGAAGSGKSFILSEIARQLAGTACLPLLLDVTNLKNNFDQFREPAKNEDELETRWSQLLQAIRPPLASNILEKWTQEFPPFLIVDKLNEVPGPEVAYSILQAIFGYVRRRGEEPTYVLAAARQIADEFRKDWTVATVDPLAEQVVAKQFDPVVYDRLPIQAKDLLSTPYYLLLALRSGKPESSNAVEAIRRFFQRNVNIKKEDLDKVSKAAFCMYDETGSTVFPPGKFTDICGQDAWKALVSAGIIRTPDPETAAFQHQLYHDFLASRYLAKQSMSWNVASFDAISLRANSFSAVTMTLEQLNGPAEGDAFLRAIYDWNITSAIESLRAGEKLKQKVYSAELETALLALMLEKLLDDVYFTRENVLKRLSAASSSIAAKIIRVATLDDIFAIVKAVPSKDEWFLQWESLFMSPHSFNEADVTKINSIDSVMGWTAVNVVRRTGQENSSTVQLREIYRSHEAAARSMVPSSDSSATQLPIVLSDTIRWRAVHALGVFPGEDNVRLLLHALDQDRYHWARYGAARSLIEIAARTKDVSLQTEIIEKIKSRVPDLSKGNFNARRILDEIGRTVFYRSASGDWKNLVLDLMDVIQKSQTDDGGIAAWKDRRQKFLDWNLTETATAK